MDNIERDLRWARLVDEDGYCKKHGVTLNMCRECFIDLFPDVDSPSRYLGDSVQRHVMRDGELTATIEIERPRRHRSGRLFYMPITERMTMGFYHRPKDGRLAGISALDSWMTLSRSDLLRLLGCTVWTLRRKKLMRGGSTVYLQNDKVPVTVYLPDETREIVEWLNRIADNPRLEKTYRFPERNRPRYKPVGCS